jgi:hypothetical protein
MFRFLRHGDDLDSGERVGGEIRGLVYEPDS